jgi:hypothetical protein
MATYDSFVQGAADAAGLGGTWKAIGSTIGVNSRTRLGMDGAGVGVLRLDSVIVANDYNDFWNGNLDNAIGIDENGAARTGDVWGGCLTSGAPEATRHLGSVIIDSKGGFRAHHGRATGTGGDWIRVYHKLTSASLPFYGMSDVLTVMEEGGVPVNIPIPNGEFAMYKPGTGYTVTATFPPGNVWARGVGDGLPVLGGQVDYSDGTTGTVVVSPGGSAQSEGPVQMTYIPRVFRRMVPLA